MPTARLFDIPQELRDVIYEYVYLPYTQYKRNGATRIYRILPPRLDHVCKRMKMETCTIRTEGPGPVRIQPRETVRLNAWQEFWEDCSNDKPEPHADLYSRHWETRKWHAALSTPSVPDYRTLLVELSATYHCRSWKNDCLWSFNLLILGVQANAESRGVKQLVRVKHYVFQKPWEVESLVTESESATQMYQGLVADLWLMTYKDCMDGRELAKCTSEKRRILQMTLKVLCQYGKNTWASMMERARRKRREEAFGHRAGGLPGTAETERPPSSTS